MRGRRAALGAVLLLALGGAGCRGHLGRAPLSTSLDTDAGQFTVEYVERDGMWAERVQVAIGKATPRLAQWGGVREPVRVVLMPTHDDLERAVGRRGYDWLKAWARYDDVLIQSPRTWSIFGAAQADIDELVLHELTHVVMYQQASDRTKWRRRYIPLWFREGMASFTAKQAYRWPTLEDLARYTEAHPLQDPLGNPDPLYRNQSDIVYAAAHHSFAFLVRRYGQERIRQVLAAMQEGADFDGAFRQVLGVSPDLFVADFKRYVRLRGFRGGRRLLKPAAPPEHAPQLQPVPKVPSAPAPAPAPAPGT